MDVDAYIHGDMNQFVLNLQFSECDASSFSSPQSTCCGNIDGSNSALSLDN